MTRACHSFCLCSAIVCIQFFTRRILDLYIIYDLCVNARVYPDFCFLSSCVLSTESTRGCCLEFLIIKCSHTNDLEALEASIKLFTLFLKTTSKQPEVFSLLFLLAFWSRGLLTESDLAISTERSDSLTKTLRQNSL